MRREVLALVVLGFASSVSLATEPRGSKSPNPIVAKQQQLALEQEAAGQAVNDVI